MVHLEFVCRLYKEQLEGGRFFLHEHPAFASSWQERCVAEILELPHVARAVGDQCQYGQKSHRGAPVKKPTGWMSNSKEVLRELSARCKGTNGTCSYAQGQTHEVCSGKVATEAAIYPLRLCKAILRGFKRQLEVEGLLFIGAIGMDVAGDVGRFVTDGKVGVPDESLSYDGEFLGNPDDGVLEKDADSSTPTLLHSKPRLRRPLLYTSTAHREWQKVYKDALTGQALPPALVEEARKQEL